jgi:Kef-type K+ transport system membrane component KefB
MTSAVIDDIAALIAVAILVPVATGDGDLSVGGVLTAAGNSALFFIVVTFLGGWVFPHRLRGWIARVPFIGRYGVVHILTFDEGRHATLAVLLLALLVGLIATYFGFHPAVGAYMAGLIVKEEYFQVSEDSLVVEKLPVTESVFAETRRIVNKAAFSWVGPVFFVELGGKIIFDFSLLGTVLPYALALFLGLLVVQVASAGLAARYTGGMTFTQSVMIGFGMLGRAELAFVVMDIAYVQNSIISDEAFLTLMITAFCLNIAVPLSIRWWRPRYVAGERSIESL